MPKPTLLQSLFNRPSQSYSGPHAVTSSNENESQQRKYHSVRNDMARVAAAARLRSRPVFNPSASAAAPSPSPVATSPPPHALDEAHDVTGDGDDNDLFFTPNGSPRQSCIDTDANPVPTNISSPPMVVPRAGQPTLRPDTSAKHDVNTVIVDAPEPNNADANDESMHHPQTPGPSSASSSTSSLNGSYTPTMSDTSWPTSFSAPSTSTRATTPATSDSGRTRSASSRSNRSRRRKEEHRQTTYTDDDWAKDVRWLVAPAPQSDKQNNLQNSISRSSTTTSASMKRNRPRPAFVLDPVSMLPMLPGAPLQIRAAHRRSTSQTTTSSRCTMGRRRMSAVWEEDEGDDPPTNAAPRRVHTDPSSLSTLGRMHSLSSQRRPPERARPPTSLLSCESGSWGSSAASSAFTSASRTVDIPVPLAVSDGGTPSGFTSLVLPRAAYTPSNKRYSMRFGNNSHVDITRSGLAQTTMSTVSITKNAAASALGGARPHFLSLSSLSLPAPHSDRRLKLPKTPSHLLNSLPPPLSFTSHTSPPSKVNSHQVLVQVYAVALDGLDDRIVSEKAARNDCYGFVPGRSFVGRAVEVGFEVNNVTKSDWVIGLLDVRKCGALAEFIIAEKKRITRSPRPSSSLTLEHLALLPLCGVPAHRALHTAGLGTDTELDSAGGRALVLQGHDGAGALMVQALAAVGMHVTAHIPVHADAPQIRTSSTSSSSSEGSEHSSTREAEERVRRWGARGLRVGDAIEVVENCGNGAFDLVIDTVGGRHIWDACQRVLAASGQFTTLIGDASPSPSPSPSSSSHFPPTSRFHSSTTPTAIPSINAHFRANLRSLRRSFGARKKVGYELVSPVADVDHRGEDVRDSLVEVVRRTTAGVFSPYVGAEELSEKESRGRKGRIVPFECAPELFGSGLLTNGRTGVVRLID